VPAQIFISHITAERELAALLKEKIERHFLGLVDVFVSSDQESIKAGASWLDALQRALRTASLEIVLCSPASINRPWINFEAGAAWLQGIPVVPLCHSGLEPHNLPMPLSALQGGKLSDSSAFLRLYNRIAELVPCECPEVDMQKLAELAAALQTTGQAGVSDPAGPTGSPAPADSAGRLAPPPERADLDQLQRAAESGNEQAVQAIAMGQLPEAWSILMDLAVNHIDEKIKIAAIRGLASFRSPGDITPLCELLVNDRWQVAEACAKALGRFKDPRAIPYLIEASDQHVDWVTTRDSVTALGVFAPQQPEVVCPALIRALELGSFEGEAAAQSLRRYDLLALPYLLDGLREGSLLRGSSIALKTIVRIGDQQALPTLEAARDRWRAAPQDQGRDYLVAEIEKSIAQLSHAPVKAPPVTVSPVTVSPVNGPPVNGPPVTNVDPAR
jgi:HEAT repeat protein